MESKYTSELTITQAVADASNGGTIYYFCHIHSRMSGKLIIHQGGVPYMNAKPQLVLYPPVHQHVMDQECGTTGIAHYTDDGAKQCDTRFVPGAVDSQFDACLQVGLPFCFCVPLCLSHRLVCSTTSREVDSRTGG